MKSRQPVVTSPAVATLSLLFVIACLVYGAAGLGLARAETPPARASAAARRAAATTARRPADFVENRGQWDAPLKFVARKGATAAAFEQTAIRLRFGKEQATALGLVFEGASPAAALAGEGRREGRYNFFVGGDSARWRTNVAAYGGVLYRGLYEGIDVRVREAGRALRIRPAARRRRRPRAGRHPR